MIKIIGLWSGSINGVLTSTIDLYYNLRKYIDVEFHLCVNKDDMSSCIRHLINNNNRDLLQKITIQKIFKSKVVICTSFIIYSKISIVSDNLFILDTFDLVKNNFVLPKIECDNVLFFANPANLERIQYPAVEYYHKFSDDRLNNLPAYYQPNLYRGVPELFLSEVLNYNRTNKAYSKIWYNGYFENIGKRIFEHLFFNKIVNYDSIGLNKPDGLFYYLKLFGIDGFESRNNIKISEHIIKEKLFMGENDQILNSIREL